ncbi:histidine kinase dimerization/phosphoacceptor domain -containing protein [Sulfitobacter aestuarii]|uniref:histidine kinase n=1 Tax=Sulfitobacter aestuarii TaxID=2161676 RepID=A0ABW5U3W9_9RHOB
MLAPKHPDEDERLRTLRSYDVLDSGAEVNFDDIVALASKICEVPVSLISLVDDDRQWFKARVGFEPHETPLDQSVCSHAILEDSLFEISDMSADPRTSDNTLHTGDPHVEFYAGARLIAPNGMPIGTLCVLDTKPRKLTEFQREALRTLSKQVVTELELRKRIKHEEQLRGEMDHRVSNSLQTISSLLRMSARRVSDDVALEVLELLERRISAVASLHGELMSRGGKGSVRADSYLRRVAAFLQDICPPHVRISCNSVDAEIRVSMASALGMIASEFAANSIKYAFPDNRAGRISIRLSKIGEGRFAFCCEDDGVGREPDVTRKDARGSGLGVALMSSAAAQLNSALNHEVTETGTALSVAFTVPPL